MVGERHAGLRVKQSTSRKGFDSMSLYMTVLAILAGAFVARTTFAKLPANTVDTASIVADKGRQANQKKFHAPRFCRIALESGPCDFSTARATRLGRCDRGTRNEGVNGFFRAFQAWEGTAKNTSPK